MTFKEAIRKCEWVIVPVVILIGCFLGGAYYGQQRTLSGIETARDTVTKVVTVYKDFPQETKTTLAGFISVPRYKFFTDTVMRVETAYLHDTTVVYLPREQKYYEEEDSKVKIWVSGYEPRLDRYEISWPETTITQTVVQKQKRWHLSLQAGWGVTFANGNVYTGPTVSAGLSYSLFSF